MPAARRERGFLALDAHLGSMGAASCLLPLAGAMRVVVPPLSSAPRRAARRAARRCLGGVHGCLRCLTAWARPIHPGALVYLALSSAVKVGVTRLRGLHTRW